MYTIHKNGDIPLPLNKKLINRQLYVCRCLVEMNTSASSAKELKKHKGT
jgi:hypothetical protein